MKISDVDRKKGLIVIGVSSTFGMRSIFHNMCRSYLLPEEIIDKDIGLFSKEDQEIIYACNSYNITFKKLRSHALNVKSITFGNETQVKLSTSEHDIHCKFNEQKFTILMRKYLSKKNIRKLIKELFTLNLDNKDV